MIKGMKVLFANTNDSSGGAARAAMRIMRGVQQSGVEAQMFVKDKYSKSPDVIPLSAYAPSSNWLSDIFKWVIQKFKNRYHMFKWHPYKRTRQNVFMYPSSAPSARERSAFTQTLRPAEGLGFQKKSQHGSSCITHWETAAI